MPFSPLDLNVSWLSFIIINVSIYLALLYLFHLVERSMQLWPSGNRMMWLSARASPWRLTCWDPKWGLVEREDMVPGLFCSSSHHHLPPLCPEARTRYYQRSTLVYGASLPLQWARRGMLAAGVTLKRLRGLSTALVSYHLFVVFVPWCIAYLYHNIFVFVSLWDGSKI